ncbi:MAG: O-antigen ligase family protein [Gammaproteobacteria bacterium]|nr:O-antigen ligase family protein [Gammaproteobacteria bacterium]
MMLVYSRWLFWAIMLLAPSLVANYYLGKDYFHLLLFLALPIAIWFSWSRNEHTHKVYQNFKMSYNESLVRWGVLLFIVSILPSYFLQDTTGLSRYAPAVEVRLMYLLPLFFVPVIWLSTVQFSLKHLWLIISVATLIVIIVTAYDIHTGADRYQRLHGHPIPFGNLSLLLGVWLLVGVFFFSQNWLHWQRILFFCLGVGGLFVSTYSGTRGGWIALPMIMLLLWKWKILSVRYLLMLALFVVFGVVAVLSFENAVSLRLLSAVNEFQQLWITGGTFDGGSIGSRLAMWKVAWQAFLSSPWWGIGIGEFYSFKMQLVESGSLGVHLASFKHAHSEYFSILSNQGVLGVLVLGLWFMWLWRIFLRASQSINSEHRVVGVLGGVMLVAYLDFCLSESMLTSQVGGVFFMLIITLLLHLIDDSPNSDPHAQ